MIAVIMADILSISYCSLMKSILSCKVLATWKMEWIRNPSLSFSDLVQNEYSSFSQSFYFILSGK